MSGRAACLGVIASLWAGSASAQFSGNEMLAVCGLVVDGGSYPDIGAYFDAGRCIGALHSLRRLGPLLVEGPFCIPPEITAKQLARTAVVGMKRRPEVMHMDFAYLSAIIFSEIWPCPPAPKKTK